MENIIIYGWLLSYIYVVHRQPDNKHTEGLLSSYFRQCGFPIPHSSVLLFFWGLEKGLEEVMARRKTNEEYAKEIEMKYHGKISLVGNYMGYCNPVELFCNVHKISFVKNANGVLSQMECCPRCISEHMDSVYKEKAGKLTRTTEDYINDLEYRGASVVPAEEYKGFNTKILHKCKACGNEILMSPNKVKYYTRCGLSICQKCSGKGLYEGKNDLWTTDPDMAKMLKDPNDGYKVTRCSGKKVDWICPDCGCVVRQKSVYNTLTNGLVCGLCSNTRSLGHRLVNSVLTELDVDYINEKTFYWSENKVYDIYVEQYNCIIEVNGVQHYEESGFHRLGGRNYIEEIENDAYKKDLAIENGIQHYVYVDAKESNIDYIVNSIRDNKLFNSLFNTKNITWENIVDRALISDVVRIKNLYNEGVSVPEIQKILHMSNTSVTRKLNELTKFGLCNYKGAEEKFKPVVCLNTGEVFDNLQEAGSAYHIDANGISFCCRGLRNRHTAGKLEDGTKLTWLFKEDYDSKTEDEIEDIIKKYALKPIGKKKVVCLNTREVFDSIKDAKKQYPDARSISDCCRHIAKSSGILPNSNKKLKWRYYDEYITLSEDEIKDILDDVHYDDKRVICLNTLEVFENATVAGEWCGVGRSSVCSCTNGKRNAGGHHPVTGEPLRWMKYIDYLASTTSLEAGA